MADVMQIQIKNTGGIVNQEYADGIAQINVINDVVRIEFFTQMSVGPDKIEPTVTNRIILPLNAYLQLFEVMKDINSKLIANGTIEEEK